MNPVTAHALHWGGSAVGIPLHSPPKAVDSRYQLLLSTFKKKRGVRRLAPSSEALGIPTLRYQSRGEDAGALSMHYLDTQPEGPLGVRVH